MSSSSEILITLIQAILWVVAGWSALFAVYLVLMLVASLFAGRRPNRPKTGDVRRFVVLIPAHNEEGSISRAVQSALVAPTGDAETRVVVVADNCTDRTAEVAAEAGADVVERTDSDRRGKGWALDYGLRHVFSMPWCDAVFIMDADSTVSSGAFDCLRPWLESGCECVQVRYEIANADSSWRTRLLAAAFDLRAHVQLLGRQGLGCSAGLMGNGMCFTRSMLESAGWPSTSITEDLEAAAVFVRRGHRIWYEPNASVEAEMPATTTGAGVQRFRWEVGQALCCVRWVPRLIAATFQQRRLDPLVQASAMLNPPLGLLVLIIGCGWAASLLLQEWAGSAPASLIGIWPVLLAVLAVYLVGAAFRSGSPRRLVDIVVSSPVYLLWKLWFYVTLPWRGKATTWVRTPRAATALSTGAAHEKVDEPASAKTRPYLVVSPVRDEAQYLERTIESMVTQTVRPATWIIVDDGSSDGTGAIAEDAAKKHDWIRVLHRSDRGERRVGGGVVEAFNDGLSCVNLDDYEFLCKLDGDLEFRPTYFERLFAKFDANPSLGTASGKAWIVVRDRLIPERSSDSFSQGQTKLYRSTCFTDIGGLVTEVMWDGIDCYRCRMRGWQAQSFRDEELRFIHLRPMGSSFKSIFHGRLRWGRGQYFMGTHGLYAVAMSVYRMFERPFLLGGACILLGYISAYLRGMKQYEDTDFRRHVRQWQLARLRPF